MDLIFAVGCLLSELVHEHLVALAQDSALTLVADRIEVDADRRVSVFTTLSYNKKDAGVFLSYFCPNEITINECRLPWHHMTGSWVEVRGIPERFRAKTVFMYVLSFGPGELITLDDGEKISGKMSISRFFNDAFRQQETTPALDLTLSARTFYEKKPMYECTAWIQENFGPYRLGLFSRGIGTRTVNFQNVTVQSKIRRQEKAVENGLN